MPAGQPSQLTATESPTRTLASAACGTKNRTLIAPSGSSATTGEPCATHSPGRYITSCTAPARAAMPRV